MKRDWVALLVVVMVWGQDALSKDPTAPRAPEVDYEALRTPVSDSFPYKYSWLNPEGKPFRPPGPDWDLQTAWVWIKGEPVLRTWIEVPNRFRIEKMAIQESDQVVFIPKAGDFPKPNPYGRRVVAFDLLQVVPRTKLKFEVTDQRTNRAYAFVVEAAYQKMRPQVILDPVCKAMEVGMKARQEAARFYYVAARCEDTYDTITVDILNSPDSHWFTHRFNVPEKAVSERVHRFVLPKARENPEVDMSEGAFFIWNAEGKEHSEFSVYYTPRVISPPFNMSAGLSQSYVMFKDSFTRISMSELAFTGKVMASYRFEPRRWTVDGSFYYTLFPYMITTSPSALSGARFYGLNGRVGYELPLALGTARWRFLAGWYFWGMMVDNNNYGIGALSGPQVFVSFRSQLVGRREWGFYGKFAFIASGSVSLSAREIAGGFYYQLNSPLSGAPLLLTGDVSNTEIPLVVSSQTLSLWTFSLGIQTSLFTF